MEPYQTNGKGVCWATWAPPFAIAFEAYRFLVYHFRYPHMAKNAMPPDQGKRYVYNAI